MYTKLLLILGIVLGVLALALLAPLGPAKQPDVVEPFFRRLETVFVFQQFEWWVIERPHPFVGTWC